MRKNHKILLISVIAIAAFFIADYVANWVMMRGVERFYGLDTKSQILLIGHSHLMLATDKERLENELGLKVSKYTREGVNVTDRKTMVEHFLNSGNADSLRYVLYGVDLCTFTGEGLSQNSYMLFYPFMDNSYVDSYIRSQADHTDYWLHKLVKNTRFNDEGLKNAVLRGWAGNWENFKNNTIDIDTYRRKLRNHDERHIKMNPELMAQFRETVELLTDRGVKVVLVNTPTFYMLNNYEPDKYRRMIDWFTEYAAGNEMVEFWDFNPQYAGDFRIFSDRLHLNRHGQQVITTELVNRIKQLESENAN